MWNTMRMTTQNDRPVLVSVRQTTGVLELNRPRALNSLNPEMIDIIAKTLDSWRDDDRVTQVLVVSNSPKGFCAGGDVRHAREQILAGDADGVDDFFRTEYAVNHLISEYPKPYATIIDGVVMGGGLGISAHGSHRIITEKAFAAMPEMAIGYVTDVGMSWLFQRTGPASPALGAFLGLTGYRLTPADMIWAGVATHHVDGELVPALIDTIVTEGIDAALAEYASHPAGEPELADMLDDIEATFGHDTWAEIDAALNSHTNPEFATRVREFMAAASPTAVVAAAELFTANRTAADLRAGLDNEERLGELVRRCPDFVEGVRAVLVDKTRDAAFEPATAAGIDPAPFRAVLS